MACALPLKSVLRHSTPAAPVKCYTRCGRQRRARERRSDYVAMILLVVLRPDPHIVESVRGACYGDQKRERLRIM
jgi:hypothetical protein